MEAVDVTSGTDERGVRLVEAARARRVEHLVGREALAAWLLAGTFLAVAIALPLIYPARVQPSAISALGALLAVGVASRVEFEVGAGIAIPTEIGLVPVLLLLPPSWVPLALAPVALIADAARRDGRERLRRAPVLVGSCWYAIGPAVVLAAAHHAVGSWPAASILVAAFAAQVGCDAIANTVGEWIGVGIPPRSMLRYLGWAYRVDAMLAPVGLAIAYAALAWPPAVLATVPLVALLAHFARARRQSFDQALELGRAYRGTALLLGDVIEADDAYTASHSRDVVELSIAVAAELHLDEATRLDVELAALLHDVGKIRVPAAILAKPGPLTPSERALIETHTLEGEAMLKQVGGLLAHVGTVVRSCHERWDGAGYPDGLAAGAIPLPARVVCVCDAFNAITTDRPYRASRPARDALVELEACAGSQFDPAVVTALAVVVGRGHSRPPGSSLAA